MTPPYFWLGIDAEPPLADETDTPADWVFTEYDNGGFRAERIEGDGFVTLHPQVRR